MWNKSQCAMAFILILLSLQGAFSSALAEEHNNSATNNKTPPEGMRWIPAGSFIMGSKHEVMRDARPAHRVTLHGFFIDQTEVSNAEFSRFVEATGYITLAERPLNAADFPALPPEALKPGSLVFSSPKHPLPLNQAQRWWRFQLGANWRHPEGPNSDISDRMDHPVVHIAWQDAAAYAAWAGKRLPTEAEWEYAARGGLDGKDYIWGDDFKPEDHFMANTFQGHFPSNNTGADGYIATSPIKSYPANGYGLYDMAGNVWEWTADWYDANAYKKRTANGGEIINPVSKTAFDPSEPNLDKRVQKGGSFLCTDQYCSRYMPGSRGRGDPNTSSNHVGFRLVKDAD